MRAKHWHRTVAVLILGYLLFGKAFAYLGVPPAKIFIGEIVVGAFLVFRSRESIDVWITAITHQHPLSEFCLSLSLFFGYGVFEVIRGISQEFEAVRAVQSLAFNYYPIYLFLGVWVGRTDPEFLARVIRALARGSCVCGIASIAVMSKLNVQMPGSPGVVILAQPGGSLTALLGLLFLEPQLGRYWLLLLINAFLLLAVQIRADWVAFMIGLSVWGVLAGQLGRLIGGVGGVAALLVIGFYADVTIPGPRGSISTREIISRAVASVDQGAAAEYSSKKSKEYAGTVSWRTNWWRAIWEKVHSERETTLIGLGYGYPLPSLAPASKEPDIRTPHNAFYYALGYGGWIGVGVWVLLQGSLCRLLWHTYRHTGQPYGLASWMAGFSSALFSNFLETPFAAIPFYLICGLSAAPYVSSLQPLGDRWQSRLRFGATPPLAEKPWRLHSSARVKLNHP